MMHRDVQKEPYGSSTHPSLVIRILGIILFSSTIIGFSFRYASLTIAQETQRNTLKKSINTFRPSMNIDSVRQFNIQKVISIIDKFNPTLPFEEKLKIADEIHKMSVKYANLDVDLICATITHESNRTWNPRVISRAGAMGLMQIMPTTGEYVSQLDGVAWTTPEQILFDPIKNIRIGCRYLSSMINSYDIDGGLAAYNGGQRIAALWLKKDKAEGILYSETSKYIPSVLHLYEEYQGMN